MNFIKKFRETFRISSIITLIAGIFLLINPDLSTKAICLVIAGALIMVGVTTMLSHQRKLRQGINVPFEYPWAILLMVLGVFIGIRSDVIISIIPFIFGLFLFISGISSLQNAVAMKHLEYERWISGIVFAALKIALAVIIIMNPFSTALTLFRFAGICLITDGILNSVTAFQLVGAKLKAEKAQDEIRDNLKKDYIRNENVESVDAEIVGVEERIIDVDEVIK